MKNPIAALALIFVLLNTLAPASSRGADHQYRAARSVHLGYPAPAGTLFYNELTVEQSVNGSYFMACGWNTGYFGIQQLRNPEDKVVLFSVWDPTKGNDPNAVKAEDRVEVLFAGEGVRIKRFGGEGTGGQCLWPGRWEIGQTNAFVVAAKIEGAKTSYTGWFRSGAAGQWKKLVTFRTRSGGAPLRGYYSFIEDFRRDGRSVNEVRHARFGNGWVKTTTNSWVRLNRARFTASNAEWESPQNINAGVVGDCFFLATGGDTSQQQGLKTLLDLPLPVTEPPPWLARFADSEAIPP